VVGFQLPDTPLSKSPAGLHLPKEIPGGIVSCAETHTEAGSVDPGLDQRSAVDS
jgi:hypothetical protein